VYVERPKELFRHCIIKPLDDQEGLIVSVLYDKCGTELYVRYYNHGILTHNWFYDFELELKEPKDNSRNYFKDY